MEGELDAEIRFRRWGWIGLTAEEKEKRLTENARDIVDSRLYRLYCEDFYVKYTLDECLDEVKAYLKAESGREIIKRGYKYLREIRKSDEMRQYWHDRRKRYIGEMGFGEVEGSELNE